MAADIKNDISIFRSQKTSSNEWLEEKTQQPTKKANPKIKTQNQAPQVRI